MLKRNVLGLPGLGLMALSFGCSGSGGDETSPGTTPEETQAPATPTEVPEVTPTRTAAPTPTSTPEPTEADATDRTPPDFEPPTDFVPPTPRPDTSPTPPAIEGPYVAFLVSDLLTTNKLAGATCERIAEDGTSFRPPIRTATDADGVCFFEVEDATGQYNFKVTDRNYLNYYLFYAPVPPTLDEAGFWSPYPIQLLSQGGKQALTQGLGLELDPTKGHVFSAAWWTREIPDPEFGWADPVGCAHVTGDVLPNLYYLSDQGLPSPDRSSTNPLNGGFHIYNLDPGFYFFDVTADESTLDLTIPAVFADSITTTWALYSSALYPNNPTPEVCNSDTPSR